MNELSCREGERRVKQREVEGCELGVSREDGEEGKGATSSVFGLIWQSKNDNGFLLLASWNLGNSIRVL